MSKRLFDICLASLCLLVCSPVLLMVAAWIKRDSPGPVLRRSRRAGRGDIPFTMFGFRSSPLDTAMPSDPHSRDGDPLLTPSGRFIHKYRLDKCAQLLNVLRGEMSLVGPSPESIETVEQYNWHERRVLLVRPGLTDWASMWNVDEARALSGAPDPRQAYERVIHPHKIRLQLYYVENRSLLADVKILGCRLVRLLSKRYMPAELRDYPTFVQRRASVARLVATEQIYRRAA